MIGPSVGRRAGRHGLQAVGRYTLTSFQCACGGGRPLPKMVRAAALGFLVTKL